MVYKKRKWEYLKQLFRCINRKKNVPIADEEVIDDVLLGLVAVRDKEAKKGIKQGF